MQVKDYYKILKLTPGAGPDEIKRNFRRLALQFHPDTNQGKKHADAWYREIQEAYLVLSDPIQKSRYLQERWLLKSKGLPFSETYPLTPDFIELRCKTMQTAVARMDHFRMDHKGLQKELLELTNDEILDALRQHHAPDKNAQIVYHLLNCMDALDFAYLPPLISVLQKIALQQPTLQLHIRDWYARRKRQEWWAQKQGWIIAGISLLLCGCIAFFSR